MKDKGVIIATVAGLLLVAGLLVFASRYRPGEKTYQGPDVEVCVLYQRPTEIDPTKFCAFMDEQWSVQAQCSLDPNGTVPAHRLKTYTVTGGQHIVTIRQFNLPLSKRSLEPVLAATDAQLKSRVANHQAFAVVRYTKGPANTMERMRFFGQVVTCLLLGDDNAIGYADEPAMAFQSRDKIFSKTRVNPYDVSQTYLFPEEAMKKKNERPYLDAITTCCIFTTIHSGQTGEMFWLHTHGMEQFGLPDFLVQYRGPDKQDAKYREALINAATYGLVIEPLRHGEMVKLSDDGTIFSVKKIEPPPDHPYGKFGVLELTHK